MTAPDAPQVEPLTLTLEEALAKLGLTFWRNPNTSAWVAGRIRHLSAHDEGDYSHAWEPFGVGATWAEAASQALGRPVVERDDTAALVAAVESGLHYIKWAEEHGHMGAPSSRTLIEAVLARVKGGER